MDVREIRHFHLFCGLGGGAKGFNMAQVRVGQMAARFRCLGGVDVDAAAIRDFERLAGVPGTVLDMFDRSQYRAFHGKEPPREWREATPDDIRRAAGNEAPHIVFLSAPCKGFSGLLPEGRSTTPKYQALNRLTVRGVWLMLEAWADDLPELIVFENVPRIANRGRPLLRQIISLLRSYGYLTAETTHDCGELGGLAQSRKRFLLVARHHQKVPPFLYEPPKRRLRAVGEVLDRMPLPGAEVGGPMHRVPSLQWRTWLRLAFVEAGSDWRSLSKLRVLDGRLQDYALVPDEAMHPGVLGVRRWDETCGTVPSRSGPTNGAYSVADPRRQEGRAEYGQFGVQTWEQTSGAVIGKAAVGAGSFAVADPRHGGAPKFNNCYRIVRWDGPSAAVTGGGGPTAGGLAVSDPRPSEGRYLSKYRVTAATEPAGTVISASATGDGAFAVADPRGAEGRNGTFGVHAWGDTSGTVTAEGRPQNGAFAVADPRTGYRDAYGNVMRVLEPAETAPTVTGGGSPSNGALCVADPRPDFCLGRGEGSAYLTAGHYGVLGWDDTAGAVASSSQHDNGRWSVADPRPEAIPEPEDRLIAVIRSMDGTWHRPFTTLELAGLQGLMDVEAAQEFRHPFALATDIERGWAGALVLDGLSDSSWRERIGNAVPPPAAKAVAETMGRTLLMAWSGEGFALSNTPIWVRPVAIALSLASGAEDAA